MGNKITRRRPTIDERYTRPQGLYPYRDVDQRKLRRLILDSKLAPCFPGGEDPAADSEECPICFLHYPSLNRSKCCSKGICTECFLQMKSPHVARATQCPFCKTANYAVEFRGAKTQEEKGVEQAEEQKVIEAKIRMREQERLEDHERELRREEDIREGRITPRPQALLERDHLIRNAPLDEIERINRQSGWGNVGHLPSQVKPLTDHEKWKQNLLEPSYCFDRQWLHKPPGPSLEAGTSTFATCGSHCPRDCSKCLMAFHKRRCYDVLDVITPPSGVWKEDRIVPSAGRWRSTWGNLDSPLSRSFPLPSRVPEYHCRHLRVFEPETLDHHILKFPMGPDQGPYICNFKNKEKPAPAPVTSLQLDRPTLGVIPESLWARRGGFVSEGGVDAAAAPQQSVVPSIPNHLPPSSQQHSGIQLPTPAPPPGAHIIQQPPSGFARNRDDEFDFDLEDIMVMEAIWLSIQDEGARHRYGETDLPRSAPSRLPTSINDYQVDPEFVPLPPPPPPLPAMEGRDQCPGRWGVTGGLAGAIAALAERQVASGDVAPAAPQQTIFNLTAPQSEVENRISDDLGSSSPTEMLSAEEVFDNDGPVSRSLSLNDGVTEETSQRTGEGGLHTMADAVAGGSETENDAMNSTRASEGLSDWVSSTQREYMGASMNNWSGDQSSEQVEVGTSFSSSIPSASELPWEAPDISAAGGNGESSGGGDNGGKVMLPESYEEQMMLAMALSLADAQSRVRQGDSNSGALVQHAQD